MNIAETREKCKAFISKSLPDGRQVPRDALVIGVLMVASAVSFGLGYLAGLDVPVPTLTEALSQPLETEGKTESLNSKATSAEGRYVASKNGTKYYLTTCSGADRISKANKVWFATAEAAIAAGYSPAANCNGL